MIEQTIAELEARLARAETVRPENRAELLALLATLRSEIAALSETHGEHAQTIAGYTSASTDAAMQPQRDPEQIKASLDGLSSSVREFESSHPGLVQIVNRICQTLANLGI